MTVARVVGANDLLLGISVPSAERANGSRTRTHVASGRAVRGAPVEPVTGEEQLGLGVVAEVVPASSAPAGRSRRRHGHTTVAPSTPRTEQFEVEAATGALLRRVVRTSGDTVCTVVARVHGLSDVASLGGDELHRLADSEYLRMRERPFGDEALALSGSDADVRIADLFGGCGGMTLGVMEACRALGLRGRAVAAFEIDDLALGVYCRNFGGPEPKRDVSRLLSRRLSAPWTQRERALKAEVGRVDLVVAGPPCQGHSNLNNLTRRKDPKNELYFRLARFVRLFQPRWVVIENVPAVQHDEGRVVERTRRALERMGYAVDDGVVRLADLGVAQTRRRHVLIAARAKGRGKVEKPLPKLAEIVERFRVPVRSVRWAIDGVKEVPDGGTFDTSARPSAETRRRIEWLFANDAYELADSERPDCHRTKQHRYTAVYGRMRPDEPAPTITGGYDTMGRGRFVHPTERRTITPHEAARIQFFPDRFDFAPAAGARAGLAQIIGNAVPPKLTYVIALELMR